jgi:hypothetical protein
MRGQIEQLIADLEARSKQYEEQANASTDKAERLRWLSRATGIQEAIGCVYRHLLVPDAVSEEKGTQGRVMDVEGL